MKDPPVQTSGFAALGRLLLALLFVLSGLGKIAAPGATQAYIAAVGLPLPWVVYGIAVVVEVGFGAALLVGFQARVAAAGLAVFTLAAAVLFHSNLADQNTFIHFVKNIAITGGLLQVVAFGAGALSLDARRLRTA
ncbi:DoxX family protein [Aquabacter sp. CN5-332]|uniref:DoxX family protein n=1 Tax=Aquabacter sp. CN5-332 TaxID=3156608 RepID=UPI0032B426CB